MKFNCDFQDIFLQGLKQDLVTRPHRGWHQLRILILKKRTAAQEVILSRNHITIYKLLCCQRKIHESLRTLTIWTDLPSILENPKGGNYKSIIRNSQHSMIDSVIRKVSQGYQASPLCWVGWITNLNQTNGFSKWRKKTGLILLLKVQSLHYLLNTASWSQQA